MNILKCICLIVLMTLLLSGPVGAGDNKSGDSQPLPNGTVREFTIDVQNIDWEIRPGVMVGLWGLSDTLQPPSLPGPLIRVNHGDFVRIVLKNTHKKPHAFHLHGYHAEQFDGIIPIPPGQDLVHEFIAEPAGTYFWHCHINTPLHQDRGMYGQFIVDDPAMRTMHGWDREFLLIVDEHPRQWESLGDDPTPATHEYIINGKAYVDKMSDHNISHSRMVVFEEDKVLLRVSSAGYTPHHMQLTGHDLAVQQGSDPFGMPKSEADIPAELITNLSLNLFFTAGAPGTYFFKSRNPKEEGMKTELVVCPKTSDLSPICNDTGDPIPE